MKRNSHSFRISLTLVLIICAMGMIVILSHLPASRATSAQDPNATLPGPKKKTTTKRTTPPPRKSEAPTKTNAPGSVPKDVTMDFNSRLGVVDTDPQGGLCFTIPNANIPEGSTIQILYEAPTAVMKRTRPAIGSLAWQGASPVVTTAIVQRKLSSACSQYSTDDDDSYYYSLTLVNGKSEHEGSIGLVGVKDTVRVINGLASVDMNADGRRQYFRICTSHEGLHLTLWSGTPLKGTRLWHQYYLLTYDTVPTCTERESR